MPNRTNRSEELPTVAPARSVSPDVYSQGLQPVDRSPVFKAISEAADAFGNHLGKMAAEAADREGKEAAVADSTSGQIKPHNPSTVFGQAYNEVAKDSMGVQRRVLLTEHMGKAALDYPDDPDELGKALDAVHTGMGKTGFPDIDLKLDQQFELDRANYIVKAKAGQQTAAQQAAAGNFQTALTLGQQLLDRTAANASFDDKGGERVATGIQGLVNDLAKYGPKSAFEIAGFSFEADPTRADALKPEQLNAYVMKAQAQARGVWIREHAKSLPTATAQAAFADDVRKRWAAGDPAFKGLDGADFKAIDSELETLSNRTATDEKAVKAGYSQKAKDIIQALHYPGMMDVDPAEAMKIAQASGDVGLMAEMKWGLTVGFDSPGTGKAGEYLGDASTAGGFAGFADWFIKSETGGSKDGAPVKNDNGHGLSKFGINKDANPEVDVANLTEPQARQVLKRKYWDAIGADHLAPPLALVAADAAAVAGVDNAKAWLAQSGGNVGRFIGLQRGYYEGLAKKDPAKYGDDVKGWNNRLDGVMQRAARAQAFQNNQDGYASDPIGFATGDKTHPARASVAALPLEAVGSEEWGQALQARRATGQTLAAQDRVPQRMLTNAEVSYYKDKIAADPASGVVLAEAAMKAIGPDGARALLREVGRDGAGVEIHIADLATGPSRSFAVSALEGMRLKSEGAQPPKYETGEDTIPEIANRYGGALAQFPGVIPAAVQTAELARLADAQAGKMQPPYYYIDSALGAHSTGGRRYGGVAQINGAYTLLPDWLAVTSTEDVLHEVAKDWTARGVGPVYDNGEPMPAREIAKLQLQPLKDGTYRLLRPQPNGGTATPVRAKNGAIFGLKLDTADAKAFIRAKVPEAILKGR